MDKSWGHIILIPAVTYSRVISRDFFLKSWGVGIWCRFILNLFWNSITTKMFTYAGCMINIYIYIYIYINYRRKKTFVVAQDHLTNTVTSPPSTIKQTLKDKNISQLLWKWNTPHQLDFCLLNHHGTMCSPTEHRSTLLYEPS